MRASNLSSSDDASVEGPEDGPCNIDLNRVPVMLGDDRAQFERLVE